MTEDINEYDIEECFLKIQNLHHTFDEHNPITYTILQHEFGDKLTIDQQEIIEKMKKKAIEKEQHYNKKMLEYMTRYDAELAAQPITEKIGDTEYKPISDECLTFTGIKLEE